MKIQVSEKLDRTRIEQLIHQAKIVDEGDYLLTTHPNMILIHDAFDSWLIESTSISYAFSEGGKTYVVVKSQIYQCHFSLKDLENEILFRINKSSLVNLDYVEKIKVKMNMKFKLLVDGVWLDVNRSYYHQFKERVGLK